MIEGGSFWLGRFVEDQIQGEAFEDLKRIFLGWKERPEPRWPDGTTFSDPRKERHWSSLTSWAITPAGVRYELLLDGRRTDEHDPREVPPVIWALMVDRYGAIYAHPRIAQMKVTVDPPYPPEDERMLEAYAGVPIGLQRRYAIGRLSRGLREETRVVSDGWRYPAAPNRQSVTSEDR